MEGNWACRVLGKAHEDATLNSLGEPLNNMLPGPAHIGGKQPDGIRYSEAYEISSFPFVTTYNQPMIIEMKFKGTVGDFDYSNQLSQFSAYRTYLATNTFKPNTSVLHGLYMILPANKNLSTSVKNACNLQNIPLFLSGVEYDPFDTNMIAVKPPELVNIDGLNYSYHTASFLGKAFVKYAAEQRVNDMFDYDEANIKDSFDDWADSFEALTLLPMLFDPCITDD